MSTTNTYTSMPGFLPGNGYQANIRPQTAGQPRLAYFIIRDNGHGKEVPVPLIPADELPFNAKLQNVSRVLSFQETNGLHYVGCAPFTGATFQLEKDASIAMQRFSSQAPNGTMHTRAQSGSNVKQHLVADTVDRQPLSYNPGVFSASLPKRPASAADTSQSWRRSDQNAPSLAPPTSTSDTSTSNAQAAIDAILRSEAGAKTAEQINYRPNAFTPPPSGKIPDQEKKEYCTYWILHGDCAYVQQGCRYKHEMPDKSKLAEIGINHTPRWWQERNSALKFGGKAIAGEKKPVSEWFNMCRSPASDGDESESGGEDTPSESGSDKQRKLTPREKRLAAAGIVGSTQILVKPKSPVVPPTRPSTPTTTDVANKKRKTSITDSDLIDFAPLQPTATTTATTPASSGTTTPPKTTKVFVPAGESPEVHIADMKKRERVAKSRTPSPSTASGLMASRHAPKSDEKEKESSPKRHVKPACRPRRAASAKKVEKK